jgi:hypothetical protein
MSNILLGVVFDNSLQGKSTIANLNSPNNLTKGKSKLIIIKLIIITPSKNVVKNKSE